MEIQLDYDSFFGLSFGFFAAVVSVRLTHELRNATQCLRRRWREWRQAVH